MSKIEKLNSDYFDDVVKSLDTLVFIKVLVVLEFYQLRTYIILMSAILDIYK